MFPQGTQQYADHAVDMGNQGGKAAQYLLRHEWMILPEIVIVPDGQIVKSAGPFRVDPVAAHGFRHDGGAIQLIVLKRRRNRLVGFIKGDIQEERSGRVTPLDELHRLLSRPMGGGKALGQGAHAQTVLILPNAVRPG